MTLIRLLLVVLALSAPASARAGPLDRLLGQAADEEHILEPDQAFRFDARTGGPRTVYLSWDIEPGYYLYRDKFAVTVVDGAAQVDQETLSIPRGKVKEDEVFGTVEVNTGVVEIPVSLIRGAGPATAITLDVAYQGCKEGSICYPPIVRQVPLRLGAADAAPAAGAAPPAQSAQDAILGRLQQATLIGNMLAFFAFGVLLSLTPCIFPMVPILAGIIVGHGTRITPARGLGLTLVFVLAVALTYAVLGVIAGSFHLNLQAASQAPAVIVVFSAVFVVLALSMFGFYELQLPERLRSRLGLVSDRQQGGTLKGAAAMGVLSAVIVGPCVAPPLAAALLYISQTGDALLGGAALFAMGLGFGVPLLVIGASAGGMLPRAGRWMQSIKRVFGVLMLAVAVWLLGRVIPGPAALVLWALLLIIPAIFMGALDAPGARWQRVWKGVGLAMLVYGGALIVGAAGGGEDPLRPLRHLAVSGTQAPERLPFRAVSSVEELDGELHRAAQAGRPVMLDFYADWCVTCKEMERETFRDPRVRGTLHGVVLLQADVTGNDAEARRLLRTYELYGPPAILFFDGSTRERREYRVIGFLGPDRFLQHLRGALRS